MLRSNKRDARTDNLTFERACSPSIINRLAVAASLKSVYLKRVRNVKDDEYTRRTRSTCYHTELACHEMTVLFLNFIADGARPSTKYRHFFVLVKNS